MRMYSGEKKPEQSTTKWLAPRAPSGGEIKFAPACEAVRDGVDDYDNSIALALSWARF